MRAGTAKEIKFESIDSLFGIPNESVQHITTMVPLEKLFPYAQHPFRVLDDAKMDELVESIRINGVLEPALVRPRALGGYEIVSGHRRKRACELAGITEIKAIVRDMTDEEAIIQMVDSNKQREKILPSEKAFAYKMKLEALKKQGKRNDLITSSPVATKLNEKGTAEMIGEEFGDGKDNVYRYIRLTELIPEILKLVDEEKMKLRPAVEISYLKSEEQEYLLESIEYTEIFPSHPQAREMKKLSLEGNLSEDEIDRIMSTEKPNQIEQVKFRYDKVKDYFPKGYTVQQMQSVIEKLLQKYQMQWQKEKQLKKYDR